MSKIVHYQHLVITALVAMSLCVVLSCCEKDSDVEPDQDTEQNLYMYPWMDHPKSYIKLCDHRMKLENLNIQRNGSALQIDYTLTNVGFGKEVSAVFSVDREGVAHDNLGNTYRPYGFGNSDVTSYFDGSSIKVGDGTLFRFMPHQTIKGSFMIKNFDMNATAVSVSVNVRKVSPSDIIFAYDRIDFVNIPVPEYTVGDNDTPIL